MRRLYEVTTDAEAIRWCRTHCAVVEFGDFVEVTRAFERRIARPALSTESTTRSKRRGDGYERADVDRI